jgi:hypothetical protein
MSTAETAGGPDGPPTFDQIYEHVLREPFESSSLGEEYLKGLAKRFRQGPLTLCSKSIGTWINKKLRQLRWTQEMLAGRVGVDRSAVAYWISGGNLTLGNLVQVLIEFQSQWSELPLPARREMAIEAYLAALAYTRESLNPGQSPRALDREGFWCLFHLLSEPHWERAIRRRDAELLTKETGRIREAVRQSLGQPPRYAVTAEFLKQLVGEWGVAWVVCVWRVPRRWPVQ